VVAGRGTLGLRTGERQPRSSQRLRPSPFPSSRGVECRVCPLNLAVSSRTCTSRNSDRIPPFHPTLDISTPKFNPFSTINSVKVWCDPASHLSRRPHSTPPNPFPLFLAPPLIPVTSLRNLPMPTRSRGTWTPVSQGRGSPLARLRLDSMDGLTRCHIIPLVDRTNRNWYSSSVT